MADFQQTDSITTLCTVADNYCAGGTNNADRTILVTTEGGTSGGAQSTTVDASANNFNAIWLEIGDGTNNLETFDGAAGNWTFRLNVTSANANVTLTGIAACRVNSSCLNQETICSDLTLSTSLGTTGVKSVTINQASAVTIAAGDVVMIIFQFDNAVGTAQAFSWSADQLISNQWAVSAGLGSLFGSPISRRRRR